MNRKTGHIAPLRPVEPDKDIIRFIERLLSEAQRGEILAIAVAIHSKGCGRGTGYSIVPGGDRAHLIAAIEMVKHRMIANEIANEP